MNNTVHIQIEIVKIRNLILELLTKVNINRRDLSVYLIVTDHTTHVWISFGYPSIEFWYAHVYVFKKNILLFQNQFRIWQTYVRKRALCLDDKLTNKILDTVQRSLSVLANENRQVYSSFIERTIDTLRLSSIHWTECISL